MEKALFAGAFFLAYTLQAITGFAGNIFAMPVGTHLMGLSSSVAVLNIMGFFACGLLAVLNLKSIQWRELGKIVGVMTPFVLLGIWLDTLLPLEVLLKIFGVVVIAIGVRNLVENRVDLAKSRNVIVVSLIISLALGITFSAAGAITFHVGEFTLNFSGLAVAAIVGIVVNAILPGKDYDFQNNYEYGKTTEDHGQML